jgi:hypothetical protein
VTEDWRNFILCCGDCYSVPTNPNPEFIYGFFEKLYLSIPPRWARVVLVSALAIVSACLRAFESEAPKTKRAEQKKRKELWVVADRISLYGRTVRQQFPTGDVVVSEHDLAVQLRKRPESVATALNLLLHEQRVQRAPLRGYWRLNS